MSILKGAPQTVNYLSFDGVDDYVDLGTLGTWASQNMSNFRIDITFSTTSTLASYIYGTVNDLPDGLLFFTEINDYFTFIRNSPNTKSQHIEINVAESLINNGQINTLSLIYNPSNQIDVLLNNNIITNVTRNDQPTNFNDFQYPFIIGARNSRGTIGGYTEMKLYDFKIYNGSTLFLHYDMSEGTGTTLVDKVGNNNATIYGATWAEEPEQTNYSFTYITNDIYSTTTGNLTGLTDFNTTQKVSIVNNSMITNFNNIHIIYFWDSNDNFLGYFKEGGPGGNADTLLGLFSNFYIPSNADTFAIGSQDSGAISFGANFISYSQFQQAVVSYNASPAIDNIYYGAPSVQTGLQFPTVTYYNNVFLASNNGGSVLTGSSDTIIATFPTIPGNEYEVTVNQGNRFRFAETDKQVPEIGDLVNGYFEGPENYSLPYVYTYTAQYDYTYIYVTSVGNANVSVEDLDYPTITYPTIDRVYAGGTLVFGTPPFGAYELISDVEVTSNTTQIDFDNLNITKDDELRLVYTYVGNDATNYSLGRIFVNNNNTITNYWRQLLGGSGSSLFANRINAPDLTDGRSNVKTSGFADIKISNNDRFVYQSQFAYTIGSQSSGVNNRSYNGVSTFTVSNITKISVVSDDTNGIAIGSRLQLYKVNKGVA